MALDADGMIYLNVENTVYFFDVEGGHMVWSGLTAVLSTESGMVRTGKIYITYYDNTGSRGTVLAEIGARKNKIANTYRNFPGEQCYGIQKTYQNQC